MRALLVLAATLLSSILVQDEARIQQLIRDLDDDGFETREKAQKELIAIGEPAIPYLKAAIAEAERRKDNLELRGRAVSALRAIEFAAKSKKFYTDPKRVTIQCADAELGQVLSDLEKQTGVKMDGSAIDAKAKVSLNVRDETLFKVLDDLCRAQEERSYEYRAEGVRFLRSRFVSFPAAYEGPFRIRMVRLKQERTTDFKATSTQIQLSLEADWQKYLAPAKRIEFDLRNATDDKGGTLEVQKAEEVDDGGAGFVVVNNNRVVVRRGGRLIARPVVEEPMAQPFTLKGVDPGARKFSIQGVARFYFPLDKAEVVFEKPGTGEPQQTGDVAIALKSIGSGRFWTLTFTKAAGRGEGNWDDIESRLDPESLTALDENGKEHKGQLNPGGNQNLEMFVNPGRGVPEGLPLATFQAVFPTLQKQTAKEIRFKFVTQVFVKSIPFKLDDVPLP
jgi:hypothetical protein